MVCSFHIYTLTLIGCITKYMNEISCVFIWTQFYERVNFISYELFESFEEGQENENIQTKNRGHCFSNENKKEMVCIFSIIYIFGFLKIFLSHFHMIFCSQNYERINWVVCPFLLVFSNSTISYENLSISYEFFCLAYICLKFSNNISLNSCLSSILFSYEIMLRCKQFPDEVGVNVISYETCYWR